MKKKICLTTLEYPPDVGGVGESAQRIAQMKFTLQFFELFFALKSKKLKQVNIDVRDMKRPNKMVLLFIAFTPQFARL
jgi:L-malate glycosyltransferase